MPKDKHFYSIDSLRGIAAVAVCLYHFSNGNVHLLESGNWLKEAGKFGFLGVEVFFVISGMVIAFSMAQSQYHLDKLGHFLVRRLVRLEPPYLLSIFLVIALNYISSLFPFYEGKGFEFNTTQLVLHFGYLVPFWNMEWLSPVYWSLGIEFQFYLVMALAFPFLFSQKWKYVFYLAFPISILLALNTPQGHIFFKYILYFFIGFLLFKREENTMDHRLILTMIAICGGFIFWKDGLEFALAGLFPVFFMLFLGDRRFGLTEFLGKISYSLYLIHVPIGGRVINLTVKFTDNPYLSMLAVPLALLVSIGFAYFFYRLVEKPSIAWAKRVSYRFRPSETALQKA